MSATAPHVAESTEGNVDITALPRFDEDVPCVRYARGGMAYCPPGTAATHLLTIRCVGHRTSSPVCQACLEGVLGSTDTTFGWWLKTAGGRVPCATDCPRCGRDRHRSDLTARPL